MARRTVSIDARMIRHSGIGVVLRGLLSVWAKDPPPFEIEVCGDPQLLEDNLPEGLAARIVPWAAPVYSVRAALSPPATRKKPDAWYAPHYATCLRPGAPLVCHIQDVLHITHPPKKGARLYGSLYLAALQRRAAYILTTSRHVKVQLQTLHRFPAERVLCTSLGPGVARTAGPATVKPAGLPREYFLAVGIDKPHKNWDFLLDQLSRAEPPKLPLVCLGLGKGKDRILEFASRAGLGNRVHLLDHLSDEEMRGVYTNATALLFPSIAEGFGLPILEAMSFGTPVLIADRSPMKEIGGGAAWKFNPDYPESFLKELSTLLSEEQERGRRVALGQHLAERFQWKKTAHRVEDALYRAMTGDLPPARHQERMIL